MNATYKDLVPDQTVTIFYYCKWEHGAKEYFRTLELALATAEEMYVKKPDMSMENYTYWLRQKQYIGIETVIETPVKIVFSPNTILT